MSDNKTLILSECTNHDSLIHAMQSSHKAMSWHSHNFYELVFVTDGFCMHHLKNSASLTMEGDILFIKPGASHCYSGTRECKIINCLFMKEALQDILQELMILHGIPQLLADDTDVAIQIHLDMQERKTLRKLLDQMAKECVEQESGWQLKTKALLYSVLVEYARICVAHDMEQSNENTYPGYVTRALHYIEEHYAEELSVQGLGEYVGISPDYLSRQFRKVTGIAVQEYIRRYRLSRAVVYLQQGCSVGETAAKSGFRSITYFSREFKSEMGVTPSHYEK